MVILEVSRWGKLHRAVYPGRYIYYKTQHCNMPTKFNSRRTWEQRTGNKHISVYILFVLHNIKLKQQGWDVFIPKVSHPGPWLKLSLEDDLK